MEDKTVLAPDPLTWNYPLTLSNDPEGLAYTRSLEFNGTTTIPNWLHYDLSNYTFSIVSTHNNYAGIHNITVVAQDDYNDAVRISFLLTISLNTAPQKLKFINNYSIVNYNYLSIEFSDIYSMFSDPDNRPMTPKVVQGNGDPLPAFLAYNPITNVLAGTPSFVHIGEWPISFVAIDDHDLEGNITFVINVKPCYFK